MANQDPHSRSVAGDSGHGTLVTTSEAKPVDTNEELIGAMGGIDENVCWDQWKHLYWVSLWCGMEDRRPTDRNQWWKCHHTSNASCCFDLCPGINGKWNIFTLGIAHGKEALLPGVNCGAPLKDSSTMPGAWLEWHRISGVYIHSLHWLMSFLGLTMRPKYDGVNL